MTKFGIKIIHLPLQFTLTSDYSRCIPEKIGTEYSTNNLCSLLLKISLKRTEANIELLHIYAAIILLPHSGADNMITTTHAMM